MKDGLRGEESEKKMAKDFLVTSQDGQDSEDGEEESADLSFFPLSRVIFKV